MPAKALSTVIYAVELLLTVAGLLRPRLALLPLDVLQQHDLNVIRQ
jgi:hypothetical protein